MVIRNSIFLFILIFMQGTICKKSENCPPGSHNKILIQNASSYNINWRLFSLDSIYTINGGEYDEILKTGETTPYGIRYETCWEEEFQTTTNGYEYFLIFHQDSVTALGWKTISGTDRGLLKRIKVDLPYLEKNNFIITYP